MVGSRRRRNTRLQCSASAARLSTLALIGRRPGQPLTWNDKERAVSTGPRWVANRQPAWVRNGRCRYRSGHPVIRHFSAQSHRAWAHLQRLEFSSDAAQESPDEPDADRVETARS